MVTLSEFIGGLTEDLAKAAGYADSGSAALSEQYYADPFTKLLPVPHYVIEEAEIDVPVTVIGIKTRNDEFKQNTEDMLAVAENRLPFLITRSFKWNYIDGRKKESRIQNEKKQAESFLADEVRENKKPPAKEDAEGYEFTKEELKSFAASAKKITAEMTRHLSQYLQGYNYEILKLLDLTEDFSSELFARIKAETASYPSDALPFINDDSIKNGSQYIGNIMFFEFKKLMRNSSGLQIDVATAKMSSCKDCDPLMRIKLKIKEQNLNLIVEDKGGKEKRYLSLT